MPGPRATALPKNTVSTLKKELADNKVIGKGGKQLTVTMRNQKLDRLQAHCTSAEMKDNARAKLQAFITSHRSQTAQMEHVTAESTTTRSHVTMEADRIIDSLQQLAVGGTAKAADIPVPEGSENELEEAPAEDALAQAATVPVPDGSENQLEKPPAEEKGQKEQAAVPEGAEEEDEVAPVPFDDSSLRAYLKWFEMHEDVEGVDESWLLEELTKKNPDDVAALQRSWEDKADNRCLLTDKLVWETLFLQEWRENYALKRQVEHWEREAQTLAGKVHVCFRLASSQCFSCWMNPAVAMQVIKNDLLRSLNKRMLDHGHQTFPEDVKVELRVAHGSQEQVPWSATLGSVTENDENWGLNGFNKKMPSFWFDVRAGR